jgi:diaminohydroxyphosphoribosylaminopyrimidine deaminase/5-amino-6-(5-phosphoribosylamino)uracil reductase
MGRALELARAAVGLASPNPNVGAVVLDANGSLAGEGTHTYAGVKHAEVLALQQAGERARGGTLYLNLEPCSHQGRTGPCADAVIAAGVKRVVAAIEDPNPSVSGRGFARLREAGIEVTVGVCARQAQRLNEAFAKWIRTGRPFVTLKSAMSLDGIIAPYGGRRTWITGAQAREHVHELRHVHDAILVGIGTVRADDPLLTDRSGKKRRRPLIRVILDTHLSVDWSAKIVTTVADDVIIFCSDFVEHRRNELEARGARVEVVPVTSGENLDGYDRLDMTAVLKRLGEMQITSVLVEGGATVNRWFMQSEMVDKVFFYYAPKIMLDGTHLWGYSRTDTQPRALRDVNLYRFGSDIAVEGYLNDPYKP